MKTFSISLTLFALFSVFETKAQTFKSLDSLKVPENSANIYSEPLFSDSLVSSFIIFIKQEVKAHKHISHSEHVYVLEGEGEMKIVDKIFKVKKGDILFIPMNTVHSLKVTSASAVKIISLQAPFFDGKDRIIIE